MRHEQLMNKSKLPSHEQAMNIEQVMNKVMNN